MSQQDIIDSLRKDLNKYLTLIENKDSKLQKLQIEREYFDDKIRALSTIHSQKIRSLMKSVKMLKKEKAKMKRQAQTSNRSEMLKNLQKEISTQDTIIEAISLELGNKYSSSGQEKVEELIVKTLTVGPKQTRFKSRQEYKFAGLRQEEKITSLESQLKKIREQSFQYQSETQSQRGGEMVVNQRNQKPEDQQPSKMQKMIENLLRKNVRQESELQDLKLKVQLDKYKLSNCEDIITNQTKELNSLNQFKLEFELLEIELQNEKERSAQLQKIKSKQFANKNDDQFKSELGEKSLAFQNESLKKQCNLQQGKIVELQERLSDLEEDIGALQFNQKQLESEKQELENFFAERDKLRIQSKKEGKLSQQNKNQLEFKIEFQQKQILAMTQEKAQNVKRIKQLERRIEEINMKMQGYDSLKKELEDQVVMHDGNVSLIQILILQDNHQIKLELENAYQETMLLRKKFKEMTGLEIDLQEQLEDMQEENQQLRKQVGALKVMNKQKDGGKKQQTGGLEKSRQIELRYKKKLLNLTQKLTDLEEKNQELQANLSEMDYEGTSIQMSKISMDTDELLNDDEDDQTI